jgi:hypothetical protein
LSIPSIWAQTKCDSALWQALLQIPGVTDCIELNELMVEQPGESLEAKVLCEALPDRVE